MEKYQIVFKDYLDGKADVATTATLLVGMYADYNLQMVRALSAFRTVRQDASVSKDENDKTLSAVKADILADFSKEAVDYEVARAHIQNIDHYLDALKLIK